MKCIYLFVLCLLAVNAVPLDNPTGQPGCQTEEELSVVNYRHLRNKTLYWICQEQGVPAALGQCPVAHGWLDDVKECVHFSLWYWTPTVQPPSQPAQVSA
ncbi:uncharacterized protein LOC115621325 [Scaptodrosophila lebanonensis]|uniref:Uncharacterized protein LOC115621325 n=1 Tax=Drosophila lebanonensis TaxID=7225 RepID=A0A6J2T6B0_DROLE|nr:uncharacterized protein LOC115621325 [Scaptodrosophila lebanonensis]